MRNIATLIVLATLFLGSFCHGQGPIYDITFSGVYDIDDFGGGGVFGVGSGMVPFEYKIRYDVSRDTNGIFLDIGDSVDSFTTNHQWYGYSREGIVCAQLTFGNKTFTQDDISDRILSGTLGLSATIWFDTDISTGATPTLAWIFASDGDGSVCIGGASGGAEFVEMQDSSFIDDSNTFNSGFADTMQITMELADPEVFDNGAGGASVVDTAIVGDLDFGAMGQRNADDVTLATTTNVTSISWTGMYFFDNSPPATDDFTIAIYADDGGSPMGGAPLAEFAVGDQVNRRASGFSNAFGDVFEYCAEIDFTMESGTTYWVSLFTDTTADTNDDYAWGGVAGGNQHFSDDNGQMWGFGGSITDFKLFGEEIPNMPPPNDNYFGPQVFFPISEMGTNVDATTEMDEQQLETTGSTVWWFFVAPDNGTVTIDTFGSDYDTQLHIYTGFAMGFPNLIPVANNDDAGGTFQSQVAFPVEAGECYDIRVGGWHSIGLPPGSDGDEGNIMLTGTFSPAGLPGDVNCDGVVNLLDVGPFVDVLSSGMFDEKADINNDGIVNLLDIEPFVELLSGGG